MTSTASSHDGGERIVRFFERALTHVKGEHAGASFALLPWQDQLLRSLFGTIGDDGLRQFRTCYLELPRKNGKSTLAAGVALYLLFADGEPGAEIYSAAADREQASIVFDMARQMVESCPALSTKCQVFKNKTIVVPSTGSVYRAISAEAYTKHGFSAHGIIFDELHAQPNRELWDVLTTSTGARRQPLTLAITTAGHGRESLCWQMHQYAEKVRDGVIDDPAFLPVIYGAEIEDDWTSEETWRKANPSIGPALRMEYLEQKCREAQSSPALENTFRRLHLNQWTEQDVRWMQMARWDACGEPFDVEDLAGQQCYGGLDLASTRDVSAFVLYFPETGHCVPWFWIPRETARQRSRQDKVPYEDWEALGLLEFTPGDCTDYDHVRDRILEICARFSVQEIAVDRWNALQIMTQLGSTGLTMVPFGQGFASMTAPMRAIETMTLGSRLRHGGQPVLRWMASNVAVETDAAGNVKPSKKRSAEKIDGIVALAMAVGRAIVAERDADSKYDSEGLVVL